MTVNLLDGKTKATNATKVTIEIDESISEGRLSSNNDVAERVGKQQKKRLVSIAAILLNWLPFEAEMWPPHSEQLVHASIPTAVVGINVFLSDALTSVVHDDW